MRGKAADLRQLFQISGITPAYAGKSTPSMMVCSRFWDHPRVCGEKRPVNRRTDKKSGITPAYAGKSFGDTVLRSQSEDHPRVCGEKYRLLEIFVSEPGSPPRMRGKD